jgi:hypothetical protein
MSKQQLFDTCMAIIFITLLFIGLAWLAVGETERPCKYVSPYKNTLQYDIHREMKCKGDK